MLQRLEGMHEVIRIRLGCDLSFVRFLNKVLVSLLLGESNGIFPRLEVHMCALHEIGRGLPAHQGILPSMTFREDVPVHTPVMAVPVS